MQYLKSSVLRHIVLDDFSATPKYQQLANSIIGAVENGSLKKDAVLPSLSDLSIEFDISRDTVERGYRFLKDFGILGSVPGKGYFIKSTDVRHEVKVLLLFNKLSQHKKTLYDSIVACLGKQALIDLYIYDNDFHSFCGLLENKLNGYTHYLIIPHFIAGGDNAHEVINSIEKSKLILLDKLVSGVDGKFGAIVENFEKDIYSALVQALERLRKYDRLKIIFPDGSYFPKEILKGFEAFCHHYHFDGHIVNDIRKEIISKGDTYICLMEEDLVSLVERTLGTGLTVGRDVGVISYNETPLKKIILNGITTISTDFTMMGQKAAEMILSKSRERIELPFQLTLRASL